jgi:hypothetical protein
MIYNIFREEEGEIIIKEFEKIKKDLDERKDAL